MHLSNSQAITNENETSHFGIGLCVSSTTLVHIIPTKYYKVSLLQLAFS